MFPSPTGMTIETFLAFSILVPFAIGIISGFWGKNKSGLVAVGLGVGLLMVSQNFIFASIRARVPLEDIFRSEGWMLIISSLICGWGLVHNIRWSKPKKQNEANKLTNQEKVLQESID